MSNTNTYGYVCDYATGDRLRPATREDWLRGRRDGERHTGAHRTDEFGERTIYIDGPDDDPEDEPPCGSVVLTHGTSGTAWQRFRSDGLWHSVTGRLAMWGDLLGMGRIVIVHVPQDGA